MGIFLELISPTFNHTQITSPANRKLDRFRLIRHKTLPDSEMQKFLTILLLFASCLISSLRADTEFVTTHSLSKQFVVYGPKTAPLQRGQRIPLDPALLAVSCERIKQTLLSELGSASQGQLISQNHSAGKIYVVIHPNARQSMVITPIRQSRSFNYRIDLPNEIDPAHLIEAVTQATLLELVNRKSPENFTQIPRWLAQGLAAQVQSVSPETIILQRDLHVSGEIKRVNPMAKIRQDLQNYEPLTFEELSWPDELPRSRTGAFEACSHLFASELLNLKKGDACLREFLAELPKHLNWQVAFLSAYQPHFKTLVDVEKWWGLRIVNLTGRDAAQRWSREQSLERIDAALRVPVKVHSTKTMPDRTELPFQEIISQWEPAQQKAALSKAVGQIHVLRPRVQPEFASLLDNYRVTLETYLQRGEKAGFFRRIFSRDDLTETRKATEIQLDSLDKLRSEMRKKAKTSTREQAMLSALEVAGQTSGPSSKQ